MRKSDAVGFTEALAEGRRIGTEMGLMRSFFAFYAGAGIQNSLFRCLRWAEGEVGNGAPVVKIVTARPTDKDARIVAEVTTSGVLFIKTGRLIPLKQVQAKCLPGE